MPTRYCPYCNEALQAYEYNDHVMDCDTPDSLDDTDIGDLQDFYQENIDDCPVEGGKENL